MSPTDQLIVCSDCASEFTFTGEEQAFFQEKGFSTPRRCKPCRAAAKAARNGGGSSFGGGSSYGRSSARPERQMFSVTCDQCGVQTEVPFKPNGAKPVYCRDCFRK